MDRKMCSHALPNTPRINDKIKEYYQKYGHGRDLQKYMRIYSPTSSQDSQKSQPEGLEACCRQRTRSRETISSNSSETLAMATRPLSGCCSVNSKSMPNIDVRGTDEAAQFEFGCKDVIVDINIELEKENEKLYSASTENIHTPKKCPHGNTKHTQQTPESVAKTHRRLEWDSLADVGYRKAMSTSNISVLERSLLKEFFKESSVTSEPSTSHREENEAQTQPREEKPKNVATLKANVTEHATPPLACSTFVDGLSERAANRGARPKMISQSTSSTSLQKKFEKYAQTSLLKPANTHSQDTQVSLSSGTSVIEGTATPSSFEYHSSRSSKSRSSRSSAGISSNISNASIPAAQHPFITSITDLLKKRKALNEKNVEERKHGNSIRELQSKFLAALDENKENHNESHTNTASSTCTSYISLTRQAPELDLGIQLICSLIDAKSVNGKQKKKLIRDIVKRITHLYGDEDAEHSNISSNLAQTSVSSERQHVYNAVYSRRRHVSLSNGQVNNARTNVSTTDLGVTPIQTGIPTKTDIAKQNNYVSSITINSTSEAQVIHQDKEQTKCKQILGSSNQRSAVGKSGNKQQTQLKAAKENRNIVPNLSSLVTQKRSNAMQSKLIAVQSSSASANESEEIENHAHDTRTTRSTQTTKSLPSTESKKLQLSSARTTLSGATTTSSSSSHDLPTQKSLRKNINNLSVDGDQPTMREWLNPLTQSEIEYEEKKREESGKKPVPVEVSKTEKNSKKSKHDCGRVQQLNWIDNEIHRLECLKHLLLKDDNEKSSTSKSLFSNDSSSNLKETNNSNQTDKLYDTVYSDKSSVLSESAERLVKEIEVILEESSEDVINLKDHSKTTKERKKETHIVYERPLDNKGETEKCSKAQFRTTTETITINEEQLLTDNGVNPQLVAPSGQRQKIDTPTSDQAQEGTESLRDMVKQRKRDFMDSYKTKKQNHYDALKLQQKEQRMFRYLPPKDIHISKGQHTSSVCPGRYSVPHTINRNFSPTEYAYPQSRLPPTPEEDHMQSPSHIVYSTAASFHHIKGKHNKQSDSSTTAAASTPSSTSAFCISSDVSVPMGLNNGSSTPTTTHHYDDVAAAVAGVAVQTSESVLRSQPIIGTQLHPYCYTKRTQPTGLKMQAKISCTAATQVKPKGIAYVIEFDDNKNASENLIKPEQNLNLAPSLAATSINTNNIQGYLTLQDHLEKAKPKFLQHTKERKAILNKLQAMRQARDRELREIIDNTSLNSLERRLKYLPPPPIQKIRILKTKEMKALTNKRVAALPEVVARKEQEKEDKKRRGNRILRDVFNRRLQRRVRNGKLSLNHSRTVI